MGDCFVILAESSADTRGCSNRLKNRFDIDCLSVNSRSVNICIKLCIKSVSLGRSASSRDMTKRILYKATAERLF